MSYHDLDKLLDDTEKSYRLTQASVDPEARKTSCVSTGLLSLDLFFGGGYIGGAWYTFFGGEQSAKSTSLSTAMAMLANAGVKGTYWDFEGCLTASQTISTEDENGKRISRPLSHYLGVLVEEATFGSLKEGEKYPLPTPIEKVYSSNTTFGRSTHVFYKGVRRVHRLVLEEGQELEGNEHPIAVHRDGHDIFVRQEDIVVGDNVLVVGRNLGFSAFRLVSVRESGYTDRYEPVWDIQVDDNPTHPHQYAVNGILTHNSSDPSYQSNIVARIAQLANMKKDGKVITVDDVFGVRNPDTGKYVIPPIFRLYTESIGDKLFDSMSALVKALPDKVFVGGKWYYVYDEKPKGDVEIDRKLSSRNSYYVEAENPHPELAIFADSYPAMYPETLDDGKGQGMAAVARMFSENIPKIAGRLRKKGIVVIGVNQLRLRPGVMFGTPEYEPSGEAVKFISSVRIKNASRSVPHGKGQVEQERSVLMDGDDEYQYICMRTQKNKQYNSTGLESWQRVWKTDPQGNAHGFDPVWNVYDYLLLTGQATRFGTGAKRKIDLKILDSHGKKVAYEVEGLDWWDFKALILYQGKDRVEHAKELGLTPKVYKELFAEGKLYEHCRKQILDGCAINMAFQLKNGVGASEDDEDEEEDDE